MINLIVATNTKTIYSWRAKTQKEKELKKQETESIVEVFPNSLHQWWVFLEMSRELRKELWKEQQGEEEGKKK